MCPREDVDDLLVERQQHNQKKAQRVQVRRKPGTDVPMTKASGGRPVRQTRKEVSKNGKGRVPKKIPKRQANAKSH